jgi:hypothetical protein
MKRLLALLAGGLGLGALLRRHSRAAKPAPAPAPAPSPADDLRAKLDASKAPVEEQAAEQASVETEDVDARRADVHARARQVIDDLGETPTP